MCVCVCVCVCVCTCVVCAGARMHACAPEGEKRGHVHGSLCNRVCVLSNVHATNSPLLAVVREPLYI